MKYGLFALTILSVGVLLSAAPAQAESSLGAGIYYQETLGDIKDAEEFDEGAISWVLAYQLKFSEILKFEVDLEMTPDFGGSDEVFYLPQGYLLLGSWIYAGAGVGTGYLDGDWSSKPFYAFRAGFDVPLGERFHVDVNANYRFMETSVLDDIEEDDADAITFGATLRIDL